MKSQLEELIEEGGIGEVNVQADWNEDNYTKDSYIQNKPDVYTRSQINDAMAGKADKVSPAVSGDIATLDANGNLTDSGKKVSDFAPQSSTYTKAQVDAAIAAIDVSNQISGKADKSEMRVSTNGDKTTITLKQGVSAEVINQHQDISGKQNVISDLEAIRSGAAAGATAVQPATMNTALAGKQDTLTFDSTPTASSTNPVTSGGVKSALDAKADKSDTYTKAEIGNLITPIDSEVIVGALPATGVANKVYRVPGTDSYTDYGWDSAQFAQLATFAFGVDAEPQEDSTNLVESGGVYGALYGQNVKTRVSIPATTEQGYMYGMSNNRLTITANSSTYYTSFGGDTSAPLGIDISAYVGKTLRIELVGTAPSTSQRSTIIADASNMSLLRIVEKEYVAEGGIGVCEVVIPASAKYLYWSALTQLQSISVLDEEYVDGVYDVIDRLDSSAVKKDVAHSKNLYNPEDAAVGYYLESDGSLVAHNSYTTSDYITIRAGQTITASPKVRMLWAYDANKAPISSSYYYAASPFPPYTYTAEADGYIRVTFFTADDAKQIEVGSSATDYEPYWVKDIVEEGIHLSETMKDDVESIIVAHPSGSHLAGKKWVHCGDSFSDYTNKTYDSGDYSGKSASFPRIIASKEGMTLEQTYMLSGRTMAYPSDGTFTNSLTCPSAACYYQNIPSDADYITIMLGINDLNHRTGSGTTPDGEDATGVITLGTIDSIDTSTYLGAYNVVLNWLRTNRPFAHVGIIITNGLGNTETARGYKEGQIAVAKKYGYPYLDLNGDQFTPAMNRFCNENMDASLATLLNNLYGVDAAGGNTHPNWQAHEFESVFIGEWLKRI